MDSVYISIQTADFDVGAEMQALRTSCADPAKIGAIVSFVGLVRDWNDGEVVNSLFLEHYQGMAEQALERIVARAWQRWPLLGVRVIHRVGELSPQSQIVLILVASSHRPAAFAACECMLDFLKTQAPFWKKEQTPDGARWVEAKITDQQAVAAWCERGDKR